MLGGRLSFQGAGDLHPSLLTQQGHQLLPPLPLHSAVPGAPYSLVLYPSDSLRSSYISNMPRDYALIVGLVLLAIVGLFLYYEFSVRPCPGMRFEIR